MAAQNLLLTRANEAKKIIIKIKKSEDEIQAGLEKLVSKKISDIDKIIKLFGDKLKGSDSSQLHQVHTSLASEWQIIKNDYIKLQSSMRTGHLNQFENESVLLDKITRESSPFKATKGTSPAKIKPVVTDSQIKDDYKQLESAIFLKDDGPLQEYVKKHTKDELKRFCQVNYLTINVGKNKKDELEDLIRTEIVKNKIF